MGEMIARLPELPDNLKNQVEAALLMRFASVSLSEHIHKISFYAWTVRRLAGRGIHDLGRPLPKLDASHLGDGAELERAAAAGRTRKRAAANTFVQCETAFDCSIKEPLKGRTGECP